jgi:hypothetical protein
MKGRNKMHYGTSTTLPPEMVLDKAEGFFGGLDLSTTSRTHDQLSMEGKGGMVSLSLSVGAETEVEIETKGLDNQVKKFLQRIG